ncbi:MAG: hypothetical protein ACREOI_00400 [bacterium]
MAEFVRSIQLGRAKVTRINIGEVYLPLARNMNVPEAELRMRNDLREFAERPILR